MVRQTRGPYLCYAPEGDFNAALIVQLKTSISQDLNDGFAFYAIDLRKVTSLDNTGHRFIKNLGLALQKDRRQLVCFGGASDIAAKISNEEGLRFFASLMDFEASFHDMDPALYQNYFQLAYGNTAIRTLGLKCPMCGNEHIKGFFHDNEAYGLTWSDHYITPVWKDPTPGAEKIDIEMYQVAVCSECLFASSRMDWFGVITPEGVVESGLSKEQKDRIANKITARKDIALNHPAVKSDIFFGFPRESKAAYLAWKLNEMTCRDMAKDKSTTDGFEIALSNLLMCKYTDDKKMITEHLDTALAWLHGVLNFADQYSVNRVMQCYTYICSVYLARDKMSEALKYQREMEQRFAHEENYDFWYQRVHDLIEEERGS